MNIHRIIVAFAASWLLHAHAQTNYEKMEVGTVIQGAIGIGSFVKPIPLPPGEWLLVNKRLDERNLTTGGGDSIKLTTVWMTLKNNKMDSSPVAAIVLSFTPDSSNINYGNTKCETNNQKIIRDDFGTNPGSVIYLCGSSNNWNSFKKTLTSASESTNSWVKGNLTALSAFAEEMPDGMIQRSVWGNRYRGRNISYAFFSKREGDFPNDQAYAKYVTDWTHADGLALGNALNNNETKFVIPAPFSTQN